MFKAGYASELIDGIKDTKDRTNVINNTFKSQAARLAFGPEKSKEIEAYVRVEDLADRLRGAMGGSTTARQLAEMGLGVLAGGYANSDDGLIGMIKGGTMGAGAAHGARLIGEAATRKTFIQVANLLSHDSPGALRAVSGRETSLAESSYYARSCGCITFD
ncbi:hypothetical protein [Brucella pseudogrignonensis]|uniref:hypothetical protein n=1 Tax=Brucella pseudogrignonensis TaxID=419475 RepID=UPI00124F205A|nr:hypothetical protein [Brucella pseudogrignonensis]KAB2689288.1 hypothetical protein F9K82_11710 [Brucella pseudogrignonensis]